MLYKLRLTKRLVSKMKIVSCNLDGSVDITGCILSIYPMDNRYADIILSAVNSLNKQKLPVWSKTDLFSTVYRGRQENVLDVVKNACQLSYRNDVHTVYELTISKGCPGDEDADHFLNEGIQKLSITEATKNFHVDCKYSFYSFNDAETNMDDISEIVNMAERCGLNPQPLHYATSLSGSIETLFKYFEDALEYAHKHIQHYVLEATISVNSPSLK